MSKGILIRVFLSILILGVFLYLFIARQNEITQMRLEIPALAMELEEIEQENTHLKFEIDKFEESGHLIELSRQSEYRHLKHPLLKEIIEIEVK